MASPIREIVTHEAPKPVGPYSLGTEAGNWVFCSGQIGRDPVSARVLAIDIEGQTHQAMKNVQGLLRAAGIGLDRAIKVTVFLKSMGDFPKFNEIYGNYIDEAGGIPPARSTVEVARLPMDVLVEIEVIACK